nr:RecName: Full=Beta-toxin Cn9; Short=Toxin-9; AltName: Full=Toxin II-14.4 [Centruroides noxius]
KKDGYPIQENGCKY